MDHQYYCIDNGAMLAQAGILQLLQYGQATALEDSWRKQLFQADQVKTTWRAPTK